MPAVHPVTTPTLPAQRILLYKSLVGMVPEVYNIGDSDTPSNLAKNHAAAYALARSI